MAEQGQYSRLANRLQSEKSDGLLEEWAVRYAASGVRMPGDVDQREFISTVAHLFASFTEVFVPSRPTGDGAMSPPQWPFLVPGSPELREVEQAAAFLGGNMASTKASGFDVAALVLSLRDVLVPLADHDGQTELARFIEWLAVVASDSFGSARVSSVHETYRELLEEGTPLVHVVPEVPAALLVGKTDMVVLDSILSRLLLAVVRVGAKAVIIDVAGVADPTADLLLERLSRFLTHRKVTGMAETLVVGLASEHESIWRQSGGTMRFFDHFDRAVAEALHLSGYRLVRTPTVVS